MSTEEIGNRILREVAMQRHHDYYTRLVVTGQPHPDDLKNADLAMRRRLDGEVEHLVDANGIKIVIDP